MVAATFWRLMASLEWRREELCCCSAGVPHAESEAETDGMASGEIFGALMIIFINRHFHRRIETQ